MKHEVSYEFIEENYPEAVSDLMAKLEAGTSKEKGRAPQDLTWAIAWGEEIPAMSGRDFFNRLKSGNPPSNPKPDTLEGRVEERLQRITALVVRASAGRWRATVPIEGIPSFVEDIVQEQEEAKLEKEREIEALSPEERQQRAEEALNQLRGSSGFMEFHVPADAD